MVDMTYGSFAAAKAKAMAKGFEELGVAAARQGCDGLS